MKTFRFFAMALAAALTFAACNPEEKKDDGKLYRITVTAGENGTATASRTEAEAGDNITLTATPADGFAFEAWTVTSGNASVADATAASTTFTMPAGDVAISAAFVKSGSEIDDTEDIRPKLKDSGFKMYADMRIGSIEKIENTTYPAWDKNGDGKLTAKEAAAVTAMNLTTLWDSIYSLEDLKWFTGLEVLIMDDVWAESGHEYLSQLPKLKVFKGSNAILGDLDFSKCADLNTVVCDGSELSSIDVSTCSQLMELNIVYSKVSGELDLSACSQLQNLEIRLSEVSKLDVSHCSNLARLDANSCEYLSELKLPQNSNLTSLAIGDTQITSFDATQHPKLRKLTFAHNRKFKGDFDLSKCPDLETLICMYTPIYKLDVRGKKNLIEIYASACSLTSVDFTGCDKLFWVEIDHNNLTYIDASSLATKGESEGTADGSFYYAFGAQVEAGTEPSFEQLSDKTIGGGEADDLAWAGYINDKGYDWGAHGVKPLTVDITLAEKHRSYWEEAMRSIPVNSRPVANYYLDNGQLKFKNYEEGYIIDLSHIGKVEYLD